MVQPYSVRNPWEGMAGGYRLGNALRMDMADQKAGAALAGGDSRGGANALLSAGNIADGLRVQGYGERQRAAQTEAENARKKELLDFTTEAASRLAEIHRTGKDPNKTLAAFDSYFAPRFREMGESEDDLAQLRTGLMSDADTTLMALGAGAAKAAGYDVRNAGDEVLVIDKGTGKLVTRYRGARTLSVGEGTEIYDMPGTGGGEAAPDGADLSPAVQPSSAPTPDVEAVWAAAKQQESGGRGDAVSSAGALGSTQMLPATAEAMARKLGIAWNPALLRETSPRALAYQDRLGRAYFEEGLEKYGNVEDAIRYYHGGPNEAQWGPKTEAHVRAVMARVRPYEVASGGDTPPPPEGGPRLVVSRPKPREQWVDLPGGGQRNTLTGKTEGVPKTSGRLSATVVKLQNDLLQEYQTASSMNSVIDRAINQIDTGKLDLGLIKNVSSQAMNTVGLSNEQSRNFASFRAAMEKMRNDSLRLNKGVQTEGDAERAWNELIANLNDPSLVRQRLLEIKDLNEMALALREDLVNQAREDSGFEPLDVSKFRAKPAVGDPGGLPQAARAALKPGQITTFANGQQWTLRNGQPARVK